VDKLNTTPTYIVWSMPFDLFQKHPRFSDLHWAARSPRAKYVFRGARCLFFCYIFKTLFSRRNKIWRAHKIIGGTAPEYPPPCLRACRSLYFLMCCWFAGDCQNGVDGIQAHCLRIATQTERHVETESEESFERRCSGDNRITLIAW